MRWFDRWMENKARGVARHSSRRGFLGLLASSLVGAAAVPLLPVARAASHGGGESHVPPQSTGNPADPGDPSTCEYWRYCGIDGFLCSCCGGTRNECPPGTEMSPLTWIGTCQNPADGKRLRHLATTTAAARAAAGAVCATATTATSRCTAAGEQRHQLVHGHQEHRLQLLDRRHPRHRRAEQLSSVRTPRAPLFGAATWPFRCNSTPNRVGGLGIGRIEVRTNVACGVDVTINNPNDPTRSPIRRYLEELHARLSKLDTGRVATYIPELARANPAWFGMVIATVDGHVYEVGDTRQQFTIQSISKPLDLWRGARGPRRRGRADRRSAWSRRGDAFNSISLEPGTGRPLNPMINAGAIATSSLVAGASAEAGSAGVVDGGFGVRRPRARDR